MSVFKSLVTGACVKVKAKKTGKMIQDGTLNEPGRSFCIEGEIYEAYTRLSPWNDDPDMGPLMYYVIDECSKDPASDDHGMDKEFFDEYFEVIE